MNEIGEETRVRLGAKQTAKGNIQMDLCVEAPTTIKAQALLGEAIDAFFEEVRARGLETANQ